MFFQLNLVSNIWGALYIAHRMRTVANADKIVVLENGKVVESGSPDELKKQNTIFSKMMERQIQKGNTNVKYSF